MGSYQDLKKLDEDSLQQLKEGTGPSDQCICNLLYDDTKKGFGSSLKKALGIGKKSVNNVGPRNGPMPIGKGGKDFQFKTALKSTKEVVKRKSPCGKCGCDDNQMVFRHSYANIRITSPDVSSICPCPTNCLPDREKLQNNIQVVVEHMQIQPVPRPLSDNTLSMSESRIEIDAKSESRSEIDAQFESRSEKAQSDNKLQ